MNIVKKLSVKSVVGSIPKPDEGETIKLCRFAGMARGIKTVTTNFGDSTGLTGDFVGINLETGEKLRAGVLYVPDVLLNMVLPEVEAGNAVEFAFDVCVTGDKSVAVGYRYSLDTVIAPTESDPMAKLLASLPAVAALESKPEPETKPKGKK